MHDTFRPDVKFSCPSTTIHAARLGTRERDIDLRAATEASTALGWTPRTAGPVVTESTRLSLQPLKWVVVIARDRQNGQRHELLYGFDPQ